MAGGALAFGAQAAAARRSVGSVVCSEHPGLNSNEPTSMLHRLCVFVVDPVALDANDRDE